MRQPDFPIVVRMARIVAQSVGWRDRLQSNDAFRRGLTVRAVKHPSQRQKPGRGRAIAFLLLAAYASAPKRRTEDMATKHKPAVRVNDRLCHAQLSQQMAEALR